MRSRAAKPKENLYKTSLQTKLRYDSEAVADDFPRDEPTTVANKSLLSKLNPFKRKIPNLMKRHSLAPGQELDPQKYLSSTQNGRGSVSSLSRNYLTQQRQSMYAMPCFEEEQDLLETTTIADLIRAIEQVHADSAMSNSQENISNIKQRKLGTDHLTPPHQSLLTLNGKQRQLNHTVHGPSSDILPLKASTRNRLYSCVSTPPAENIGTSRAKILGDSSPFVRHLSIRPPPPYTSTPSDSIKPALKRRFSVRPSNLELAPGQFHKPQNSQVTTPSQQQTTNSAVMPFQRKLSWRPQPSTLAHSNETQKGSRQKTDSTSSTKPT